MESLIALILILIAIIVFMGALLLCQRKATKQLLSNYIYEIKTNTKLVIALSEYSNRINELEHGQRKFYKPCDYTEKYIAKYDKQPEIGCCYPSDECPAVVFTGDKWAPFMECIVGRVEVVHETFVWPK